MSVLGSDPERYSVSLGLVGGVTIANSFACTLYVRIGNGFWPLLGVSIEHPVDHCSLNDVGGVIVGELFLLANDATAVVQVWIGDTSFKSTQDDI